MTQPGRPARRPRWAVAGVLVAVAIAGPLLVPIYARTGPKLGGFPFFYWYQLILVPVVAALVTSAYLVTRRPATAGTGDGDA
jgi:hypothetical protein